MKSLVAVILIISLFTGGLRTISLINEYAATAAAAYEREEYIESIAAYEYLLNDREVQDDQLRLNLGHSYFKIGELQKAQQQYTLLAGHSSRYIRAVALLQLGNIAARNKKYKQALSHFRHALILEPGNEDARYNYELLKKYLAQRPELANEEEEDESPFPEDQLQNQPERREKRTQPEEEDLKPQPKKKPDNDGDQEEEIETQEPAENGQQELPASGSNNSQSDQAGKPEDRERQEQSGQQDGDTQGIRPDSNFDPGRRERSRSNEAASETEQRAQTRNNRLQQMNINPEKARLMLDAMRSAEQQYIQQLPKKATRKPDSSKPDW